MQRNKEILDLRKFGKVYRTNRTFFGPYVYDLSFGLILILLAKIKT